MTRRRRRSQTGELPITGAGAGSLPTGGADESSLVDVGAADASLVDIDPEPSVTQPVAVVEPAQTLDADTAAAAASSSSLAADETSLPSPAPTTVTRNTGNRP